MELSGLALDALIGPASVDQVASSTQVFSNIRCSWSGSTAPRSMRISELPSPLVRSTSSVLISAPGCACCSDWLARPTHFPSGGQACHAGSMDGRFIASSHLMGPLHGFGEFLARNHFGNLPGLGNQCA